ncbi:hypothetical protein PTSG_01885 [Salpingoeca rosetta]|uniref:Cullin family profile domain-containing protein n=1 Tax=Salpingoeca rosetta (strain ATCC 50818 / BSB-021) TaxID=946362 RepID=F2TZ86_SALR5|nr:uncharacterized protein PTSG_01885 [Salpingoeca rosetta]EGD78910.1 hypothetical protein PTSG_01885 [Salpingoeca rosetta]|eukprot:XP_004997866.1 hypothetical protein PTSG_01885 [Salpingoeca rosetta]
MMQAALALVGQVFGVAEPLRFGVVGGSEGERKEHEVRLAQLREAVDTALSQKPAAKRLLVQFASHHIQQSLVKSLDVSRLVVLGLDSNDTDTAGIDAALFQERERACQSFTACVTRHIQSLQSAFANHRAVADEAMETALLRVQAGLSLLFPVSTYKDLQAVHVHILWETEKEGGSGSDDEDEDDDDEREGGDAVSKALRSVPTPTLNAYLQAVHALLAACRLDAVITLPVLKAVAITVINRKVQQRCAEEYEDEMLPDLLAWHDAVIQPFFAAFAPPSATNNTAHVQREMRLEVYKALGTLRVAELFDIIIEYPSSLPAIRDIKKWCVALLKRLLHPGPQTSDIINQYISTVKTLRTLDPSGVLLELVCSPVREYLKRRPDTVRCIVELLIAEDADDFDGGRVGGDGAAEDWLPDPIDAYLDQNESLRKDSVLDLLTSIYGSKELLVEEYAHMLAENMLQCKGFDIDEEIRTTEVLRARFGEEYLRKCAVMIKDFANSRRLHTAFERAPPYESSPPYQFSSRSDSPLHWPFTAENVRVFVLSRLFWPGLKTDNLDLPKDLETHLQYYMQKFKGQTQMQTLEFRPTMGTVDLTVELETRTLELRVPPVAAAALLKFEEQSRWDLDDLAAALNAPPAIVMDGLRALMGHGVVVQVSRGVFEVDESGSLQQGAKM